MPDHTPTPTELALADALEREYGPLLGYDSLARLLNRSRRSVRKACADQAWGKKLLFASILVGRRRYFLPRPVAALMLSGALAANPALREAPAAAPAP